MCGSSSEPCAPSVPSVCAGCCGRKLSFCRTDRTLPSMFSFTVPDGDTGTNMYLTMRSTMEEAERCEDPAAGAVLAAMSHGALMGARGNSGVILSQIIGGLARGVDGATDVTPKGLAAGLEQA